MLYVFIIYLYNNYHHIFLFIFLPLYQYDVFEYLYACIVIYYSSINVHFYSKNVRYESVVELMYIEYFFFGYAVEQMYLTEKKLFQTQPLIFHQQTEHKSYPKIIY